MKSLQVGVNGQIEEEEESGNRQGLIGISKFNTFSREKFTKSDTDFLDQKAAIMNNFNINQSHSKEIFKIDQENIVRLSNHAKQFTSDDKAKFEKSDTMKFSTLAGMNSTDYFQQKRKQFKSSNTIPSQNFTNENQETTTDEVYLSQRNCAPFDSRCKNLMNIAKDWRKNRHSSGKMLRHHSQNTSIPLTSVNTPLKKGDKRSRNQVFFYLLKIQKRQ